MRDVMENGPYLSAVSRMLELGLLESAWKEMTPAEYNAVRGQPAETLIEYRLTPLAEAVRRIGRESLREAPEEIEIATQNAIAVGVSEKGVIDPT
jgi:RecB family exonuclease